MIDDFTEDDDDEEEDEEEEESLSESVETTTTRFGRFMSPLAFFKFSETLGKYFEFVTLHENEIFTNIYKNSIICTIL